MDNIELNKEVSALKNLSEDLEKQLKEFGLDLDDLPDDCSTLLNEYSQIKTLSGLHNLDLTFLKEFYYNKRKDLVEHNLNTAKLKRDIQSLENQIQKEDEALAKLRSFSNYSQRILIEEAEMELNKTMLDKQLENFQSRKQSAQDHNIRMDQLISKLEILEERKKK